MARTRPVPDLQNAGDEELLRYRIRDLRLQIPGTVLESRVARLYAELDQRGMGFKPPCYLADEWLCPDQVPIIGIPFFLAHPRLTALEKRMMLEAEGSTEEWCMKLLRHECGHAMNYAYRLFARRDWRKAFGPFDAPYYTVTYTAKPYSKRFVVHLDDNYAQAHPDEDFAETFAVWLDPESDWQGRYRGWPALEKLEYLDAMMREAAGKQPLVTGSATPWSAGRMSSTLGTFYQRKRKYLGSEFPGFYDPGLRRIFDEPGENASPTPAERFLRRHRKALVQGVSLWVPQRKYDVDRLLEKLIVRCKHLDLRLRKTPDTTMLEVGAFVTAILASLRPFNGVHDGK